MVGPILLLLIIMNVLIIGAATVSLAYFANFTPMDKLGNRILIFKISIIIFLLLALAIWLILHYDFLNTLRNTFNCCW